MRSESENREKLKAIVKGAHTAFMVSGFRSQEGPHGRPMATAGIDEAFTSIWFATARDSGKISELRSDSAVCLGYANSTGTEWASVTGVGTIVDDPKKAKELWSPLWKAYFSGPDDPNLILIRISPQSAEYWDSGNFLFSIAKLAFAAATGKTGDVGENEQVHLSGSDSAR